MYNSMMGDYRLRISLEPMDSKLCMGGWLRTHWRDEIVLLETADGKTLAR